MSTFCFSYSVDSFSSLHDVSYSADEGTGLRIKALAGNIFNKQSRTDDWGVGGGGGIV